MGLLGQKPGAWWVKSASDPRWDGSGRAAHLSLSTRPPEAEDHVEAKKRELEALPPADLEFGWEKD